MLCMYHLVVIWYSKKICTWLAVNTVLKSVFYFTLMWNNNRKMKSVYIIKTLENLCIEQIHMNINMTLSKPNFGQNVQWHLYKCLKRIKEKSSTLKGIRFFYIILSTYCLCCHCQQSICTSFPLQNKKKHYTIYQAKIKYFRYTSDKRDVTFLNNITV